MLKLPTEGHRQQVKTAASERGRSEQGHSKAQLEAVSDAIERSVSETLSAQVVAMLEDSASSLQQSASAQPSAQQSITENAELDEIIARARLSKRQMDVLRLLGEGKTN